MIGNSNSSTPSGPSNHSNSSAQPTQPAQPAQPSQSGNSSGLSDSHGPHGSHGSVGAKNSPPIPLWLREFIKPEDLLLVSKSIGEVESRADGEVVPMIVRSSLELGYLPRWTLGFLLSLVGSLVFVFVAPIFSLPEWWGVFFEICCFVIGFLLGREKWVLRALLPESLIQYHVGLRAEVEFYRARLNETKKRNTVLIYLSFSERKVFVLADQGIASKVNTQSWKDVAASIASGMKAKDLGSGLVEAINRCGRHLEEHFPNAEIRQNEVPNQLIFRE